MKKSRDGRFESGIDLVGAVVLIKVVATAVTVMDSTTEVVVDDKPTVAALVE